MAEIKRNPKTRLHEGKSYGLCVKCNKEFKLKRKTKHNKNKKPKGICKECAKNQIAIKQMEKIAEKIIEKDAPLMKMLAGE